MQKTGSSIHVTAHAKINLSLDIVGKRPDGYHLVRMIMQTIRLHDDLIIEKKETPGIRLKTDCPGLPADGGNLIVRAAERMLQCFAPECGVSVSLTKRIPLAAGLAGGSADAAAVMRGLNALFGWGLDPEELCRIGVELGADIPFCLCGGTALAEGIGEQLTPLPTLPDCAILLAKPQIPVSTAEIYRLYDREMGVVHPDIDGQAAALQRGDAKAVTARIGNVLEPVTGRRHPEIYAMREQMLSRGAVGAGMSGSGPTVFGIFEEKEKAETVLREWQSSDPEKEIILTAPVGVGIS